MLLVLVVLMAHLGCGATTNNSNTTVESVDPATGQTTQGYFPAEDSSDTGITTDMCGDVECTEGATPSSTPTASYGGFPDDVTAPTVVSIVVNGSYTLTEGATNFPLFGSGSDFDSFTVTFDKAMLTDQTAGDSGSPVDSQDMTVVCGGTTYYVIENSVNYSTDTTLVFELNTSLPAQTACELVLNGKDGTQRIRDYAHNPLAETTVSFTTACGVDDDFTDGLGCWTVLNSSNGTFTADAGVLTLSIDGSVVSEMDGQDPSAAGLRKTGIRVVFGGPFARFELTLDSITGFSDSGDGVGLRLSDDDGNYAVALVSNTDGVNTYRTMYGTSSTDTDAFEVPGYTADDTLYIQADDTTVYLGAYATGGGRVMLKDVAMSMDLENLTVEILGMKNNSGVASTITMSNFSSLFVE